MNTELWWSQVLDDEHLIIKTVRSQALVPRQSWQTPAKMLFSCCHLMCTVLTQLMDHKLECSVWSQQPTDKLRSAWKQIPVKSETKQSQWLLAVPRLLILATLFHLTGTLPDPYCGDSSICKIYNNLMFPRLMDVSRVVSIWSKTGMLKRAYLNTSSIRTRQAGVILMAIKQWRWLDTEQCKQGPCFYREYFMFGHLTLHKSVKP